MSILAALTEDVYKCNKCGFCQEVCPTYKTTGEEFSVARGRNRLVRLALEGILDLSRERELEEYIYSCILCGSCVSVCPSAVPTDRIVAAARAELVSRKGQPLVKRLLLRGVVADMRRIRLTGRILAFYQRSGLRWLAKRSGLLHALGNLGKIEEIMPDLSSRSTAVAKPGFAGPGYGSASPWARSPEDQRGEDRRKEATAHPDRVGYFIGCAAQAVYRTVPEAVREVLAWNGTQTVTVDNVCCGLPHQAYGDFEKARDLARANIDLFSATGLDIIIFDCATCGHTLREYKNLLKDDEAYRQKAASFSAKIMDVNDYLVRHGFQKPEGEMKVRVTYHDPCHLARGMGVRSAPREVLKSIPGVDFVEMNEADMCCGGGGSYNITHYQGSLKILERKMKNYQATGAELLSTSCPGCTVQLSYGLKLNKLPGTVVHPVELLRAAYRAEKKGDNAASD